MKVNVRINDPWELGEMFEWRALEGIIISGKKAKHSVATIVVKLNHSFTYQNTLCEIFVACPRHKGDHFDALRAC